MICFVCLLESSETKVPAYWWCHLSFIPFKEDYKKWKRYVCLESCVPKESTLFFEPKVLEISNCANDFSILGLVVKYAKSRRRWNGQIAIEKIRLTLCKKPFKNQWNSRELDGLFQMSLSKSGQVEVNIIRFNAGSPLL